MEDFLNYFDLDLLPLFSPGVSDGVESKVKNRDNLDFIMSGEEDDSPQPCISKGTLMGGEEQVIDRKLSDEAYAVEALGLLQLPAQIDTEAASEGTAGDHSDSEVPLSPHQLELILQSTCTVPGKSEQDPLHHRKSEQDPLHLRKSEQDPLHHRKSEQDPLQPLSGNTVADREDNCSIIVIKVQTTPESVENVIYVGEIPAASVEKVDGIATLTTGFQSQDLPLGAKRSSRRRRRRDKRLKAYQLPEFKDPEMEKKRQNAINAKNNRERKKQEKMKLTSELNEAVRERNELQSKVGKEKTKNSKLKAKLKSVKEAFEGVTECYLGFQLQE